MGAPEDLRAGTWDGVLNPDLARAEAPGEVRNLLGSGSRRDRVGLIAALMA